MKKKQFKFKGVVLACCLAASMPLGITTPFEISAMADVVAHNVDITPPAGTADKASYIKTAIENALAAHDIIRVSGNAQMEPTANSIEITIPQGKKIIWEASITGSAANVLLKIKSTGTGGEFEMVSGTLRSEAHSALASTDRNGYTNFTIKGGEIISGKHASAPTVNFNGKGRFNMTAGTIINYAADYALTLQPKADTNHSITGGTLLACGEKNAADIKANNDVIGLAAPPSINSSVDIDAQRTNIICWNKTVYNNRTPVIRYVAEHDSRDILAYPGSQTKFMWTKENGNAAIKYTNSNGESGSIVLDEAAVENIDFPNVSDAVYDKSGHGADNFEAPDHSNIGFKYKDAQGNISSDKPVNAGEYEVTTKLSPTYGELEVNLGKFTINKRPVTVEVADKEINVNEALPNDFSDYSVSNLANEDNREDAIMQMPSFTWGTDGTSVGEFNISTSTAINYTNNYMPASTALRGVLKVKAAQSNSQQPQQQGTPQQQPQTPDTQPNKSQQNQTPEKKPNKPQTPEKQPQIPQQPEKKNPSDIVTPGKSGSEDNKAHGKATPSVPKKPDNSGGGRRKGRNSGGGSGRGSSRDSKKDKSAKNNNKPLAGTWINDANGWWYKEPNGAYPKSTWKQIDYNGIKNWYYFDEQGYMATGWKLINDKWYYMYENTEKGHIKGSMAYSTKVGEYKIGFDGAWIK
ncbi:hypothetical protein EHV10_00555 [Lachnoanaerobaculum gingivalis]|uniref:N-acetylmuramoyl-L-alanine amidase family protein n=1 Tax=Lachnoanaerobaculum gingivalis TaxID=2490855 RepID=A0A3P3QZA1_9FIRM|nr:hypothetical protein [Lachnoanaerobaculum gingivalis]RRJ26557.1 hypothetical protein EHV10_00555 [Lachnoanaerobaculum gingivalis]